MNPFKNFVQNLFSQQSFNHFIQLEDEIRKKNETLTFQSTTYISSSSPFKKLSFPKKIILFINYHLSSIHINHTNSIVIYFKILNEKLEINKKCRCFQLKKNQCLIFANLLFAKEN